MLTESSQLSCELSPVNTTQGGEKFSSKSPNNTPLSKATQSLYQVPQQVKFLHLQAEVESLLQQLQYIKQQRLTATSGAWSDNRN